MSMSLDIKDPVAIVNNLMPKDHPAQKPLEKENVILNIIPVELQLKIFTCLEEENLANCALVCSTWNGIAKDDIFYKVPGAFGKEKWEETFKVEVGKEPKFPFRNYKIKEGEILFLVPATINGQPFDRKVMGQLFAQALGDEKIIKNGGYSYLTDKIVELPKKDSSCWAAMKDRIIDVEPGLDTTRRKSYKVQADIISRYDKKYSHPTLDAAIIGIFIARLRNGASKFGELPLTYTRVQEKIKVQERVKGFEEYHIDVGGFGPRGLEVFHYDFDDYNYGAAPFREFLSGT